MSARDPQHPGIHRIANATQWVILGIRLYTWVLPLRRVLASQDSVVEKSVLAHALPFVAGSVNASGFFVVGTYTSHVTGSVARIGDELAQGHRRAALAALLLIASFFGGAFGASAMADWARRRGRGPYSGSLEIEALVLTVVTALGIAEPRGVPWLRTLTTSLLCLAMGMQNAMVTRLSGAVVRTTHLTGIVTDMGIESWAALKWLRGWRRDHASETLWSVLLRYRTYPELAMLRLHTAIFLSFFAGAIAGPALYVRYGYTSMLLPIGLLLLLIVFDRVYGLHRLPPGSPAPPQGSGQTS